MHQRSMMPQPKTTWKCECGADLFNILLCPECKGDDSHVIGFQCIACESIFVTPAGAATIEENENVSH